MNIETHREHTEEDVTMSMSDYLAVNAKLQQKKNAVRKILAKKGVLQRQGTNTFDKYKYFTEAQYKTLFTDLFSDNGLELSFKEESYLPFDGTDKQPFGRMVKITFSLIDIDTGFSEDSTITGEGLDKGDKAGYKAYTGALKYWLANTFMVATGDDPETESPDGQKVTKCSECGNEIKAIMKRDGNLWDAKDMASYSTRKYGRPLCAECMKKQEDKK